MRTVIAVLFALAFSTTLATDFLEAAPSSVVARGEELLTELQQNAKEEGFLQKLFGSDCYAQAVRSLTRDCRHLTEEDRARLAYNLARCFLSRSTGMDPPRECPKKMAINRCTRDLNEKAFNVYTHFYTHVHSVCLYISNQNFLLQAEALSQALYGTSTAALSAIVEIRANISKQQEAVASLGEGITSLQQSQTNLSAGMSASLQGISHLTNQTEGVSKALESTMLLQQQAVERQRALSDSLSTLADEESSRAALAKERWQAAEQAATAMEARQLRYEVLQSQLMDASATLVHQAGGLQSAVQAVLSYEQRTDAMLAYMMGSSYQWSDVAFYTSTALLLLLLGPIFPLPLNNGGLLDLRFPGMMVLGASVLAERTLLSTLAQHGLLTSTGQLMVGHLLPAGVRALVSAAQVNPRWLVRGSFALLTIYVLRVVTSCRPRHKQRVLQSAHLTDMLQSLDEQLQIVAEQQIAIIRHVQQQQQQQQQQQLQARPPRALWYQSAIRPQRAPDVAIRRQQLESSVSFDRIVQGKQQPTKPLHHMQTAEQSAPMDIKHVNRTNAQQQAQQPGAALGAQVPAMPVESHLALQPVHADETVGIAINASSSAPDIDMEDSYQAAQVVPETETLHENGELLPSSHECNQSVRSTDEKSTRASRKRGLEAQTEENEPISNADRPVKAGRRHL